MSSTMECWTLLENEQKHTLQWQEPEASSCNSHYLIFQTTSDELLACLNISWLQRSVKPYYASEGLWGLTELQQASNSAVIV